MMRYGIPAYRMPRDVLDAELDRIAAMGVRFTLGHRVEDLAAERREGGFDAVFVAVGAHLSKRVDIPAKDAAGSWTRCRSCAASPRVSGR
jgi:NADPH-dependent glutamate synthase beta subunit-like oxidoreductase